jgi:aspartyl-tRNA(Asn)/glutamyl-tRNA(Gln) amidotransferase subunit C
MEPARYGLHRFADSPAQNAVYFTFGSAAWTAILTCGAQDRFEITHGELESMAAKVTEQDVQRVAELAHLELKPAEAGAMLEDLNAILSHVAELNELDTTGVAPLAQVTELLEAPSGGLRPDKVQPSLDRATVLAQAPETNGAFFKVPKVLER